VENPFDTSTASRYGVVEGRWAVKVNVEKLRIFYDQQELPAFEQLCTSA
jgi:hypothetical protein